MNLFSKETAITKTIRVTLYTAFVALVGYFSDPEVVDLLLKHFPQWTALITAGVPIVTLIANLLNPNVRNR